jgi:RNA recognition motif-containing protein
VASRPPFRFRVFIQGFPKGVSEKSLKEHFEPCGEIRQVTMPKKKDTLAALAKNSRCEQRLLVESSF